MESLTEGGLAPSSIFASTSSRDLPWATLQTKRATDPGPSNHADGALRHKAMSTLKGSSRNTAAFASAAHRFAQTKHASGGMSAEDPSTMGRWAGVRPHAAFASRTPKHHSRSTANPGPGAYRPEAADTDASRSRSSAALASTSERRLPFESGGGRGTDLETPPPTAYSPRSGADFRGRDADQRRAPKNASAAMGFTSPRFTRGHCSHAHSGTPGPGSYSVAESDWRTMGSSTSGKPQHGVPISTEEGRLRFDIRPTPGAGAYTPRSSARGMGDVTGRHDEKVPNAAFCSSSRRLASRYTASPGPGAYETGSQPPRTIRRSASFGSSSSRFTNNKMPTPGPGAYGHTSQTMSASMQAARAQAAFSSSSARTQLPTNTHSGTGEVPGPGAHEHTNPVSDFARPLRRSASFSSASSRLSNTPRGKAMAFTPGPGAYTPLLSTTGQACAAATQRYSIKRVGG